MNRTETAEFTLLVYHHLVCLSDADAVRERFAHINAEKVPGYDFTRDRTPPWTPADSLKAIYRRNHVSDAEWDKMLYEDRKAWIMKMIAETGKTVIA